MKVKAGWIVICSLCLAYVAGCELPQGETSAPPLQGVALEWLAENSMTTDGFITRDFPDGRTHHLAFTAQAGRKAGSKLAVLQNGSVVSLAFARGLFDREYLANWGRVHPEVANLWKDRGLIGVAITVRPELSEATMNRIREVDPSARFSKLPFPHVVAQLTWRDWLKMKGEDGVIRVDVLAYGAEEYQDPGSEGSSHHSRTASKFNANGFYAEGVRVGLVETAGNGCGVWESHEAFEYNTITSQQSQSCNVDSDCDCAGAVPFCDSGTCVAQHLTQVAGRVSHTTQSEPHHAAYSHLFIANEESISFDQPYGTSELFVALYWLGSRYQWLLNNEVYIVNGSWGYRTFYRDIEQVIPTFRDSVEDFYSRFHNMTFVRATGSLLPKQEVDCHAMNSICVNLVHDNGTISDDYSQYLDDFWSTSFDPTYRNPFTFWGSSLTQYPSTDIERPDLATASFNVPVPNLENGDPTEWKTAIGSSFAAPVVTGSLALLQECRGEVLSPIRNRAIMRNSASVIQEVEHSNPTAPSPVPLYPERGLDWSFDTYIGSGIHHAAGLSCHAEDPGGCGEGIECGDTEIEIDLDGGDPLDSSFQNGPLGSLSTSTSADGINLLVLGSNPQFYDDKRQWEIRTFEEIGAGTRIRADLAWYGCSPTSANGSVAELGVGVDIDLVLCAPGIGCEALSESVYDNAEGFDVVVSDDYDELTLYAIWDAIKFDGSNWVENFDCEGQSSTRLAAAWRLRR